MMNHISELSMSKEAVVNLQAVANSSDAEVASFTTPLNEMWQMEFTFINSAFSSSS